MKYLLPLILVLSFSSGCVSIPRLLGIKPALEEVTKPKKPQTPKEHMKALCRLGRVIGFAGFIIGIVLLVIGKTKLAISVGTLVSGIAVCLASYFMEAYLEPILYTFLGLVVGVAVYIIWVNWERLKTMAKFGDAAVAAGELTKEQIHEIAENTVGAEGSQKREDIKAVVAKART